MTINRMKKIVGERIETLAVYLNLNDFDISYSFGEGCTESTAAMNSINTQYLSSHITINPNHVENEMELIEYLLHELVHLWLRELYPININLKNNGVQRNITDAVESANDSAVVRICRFMCKHCGDIVYGKYKEAGNDKK